MNRHRLSPIGSAILVLGLSVAHQAALAQAAPAPAAAASQANDGLITVVVTAQKRSQNIKDVPIAMSVVGAEELQKQGIRDIGDLSKTTASLEFGDQQTGGAGGSASIRGIGTAVFTSSAESSVGVVVDGVPLGNTAGSSLFDLAQVEVLRGPQGTLFGKNASAGVLNMTTNAPRIGRLEGEVSLEAAGGQAKNDTLHGALNVPINDISALRVTTHVDQLKGVYDNVYTGQQSVSDSSGARVRYLLKPNADLVVNLIADHDLVRRSGAVFFAPDVAYATNTAGDHTPAADFAACGVTVSHDNNKVCSNVPEHDRNQVDGFSSQIDLGLAGGTTLTSITAVRLHKQGPGDSMSLSMDLAPDLVETKDRHGYMRQVSQELRLAAAPHSTVDWVGGLFLSNYTAHIDNTTEIVPSAFAPSPPSPRSIDALIDRKTHIQTFALFGQATTKVNDSLSLLTGLRLTRDKVWDAQEVDTDVAFDGFALPTEVQTSSGSARKSNVSGKVGLLYALDADTNGYLTLTRGYKGPQIDDGTPINNLPGAGSAAALIIKPELPTSLEAGVKTTLFDHRLAIDAAVFHTTIRDFQEQNCTLNAVGSLTCVPLNVPKVTSNGIEADIRARVGGGLTLTTSGALILDTEYPAGFTFDGNDVGGQRLLYSPKAKLTVDADWSTTVWRDYEWSLGADATYKSRVRYCNTLDAECAYKAHTIFGLRTGLRNPDDTWGVTLFVRNLTDQREPSAILYPLPGKGAGSGFAHQLTGNSFRSTGITLDYKF